MASRSPKRAATRRRFSPIVSPISAWLDTPWLYEGCAVAGMMPSLKTRIPPSCPIGWQVKTAPDLRCGGYPAGLLSLYDECPFPLRRRHGDLDHLADSGCGPGRGRDAHHDVLARADRGGRRGRGRGGCRGRRGAAPVGRVRARRTKRPAGGPAHRAAPRPPAAAAAHRRLGPGRPQRHCRRGGLRARRPGPDRRRPVVLAAYDETLIIPVGATVDVMLIEGATALVYPRE